MSKPSRRITLTEEELGALHHALVGDGPALWTTATEEQKKDWHILSNLNRRASVGLDCFCGGRCTCGG